MAPLTLHPCAFMASPLTPVTSLKTPNSYPLVGHLIQLSKDPLKFLSECSEQYGDIVPLRCAHKQGIFINNPKYVETVLKKPHIFAKSRAYHVMKSFIGEGLITSEGASWQRQRHLVQPVFQHQRIAEYADAMVKSTQAYVTELQLHEQRNIHDDMRQVTLDIVMKCIFGEDINKQESDIISQSLNTAHKWFESKQRSGFFLVNLLGSMDRRYHRYLHQMDAMIYRIIQARRAQSPSDRGDLLAMMIQAYDHESGDHMTDQQLRDEVATLMLAGHETTAATLSWIWMLLANHTDKLHKLEQEIDTVLLGRPPSFEDIAKLNYTNAIIKETMRLYPPVSIMGRICKTETTIDNYQIPQDHFVLLSQWVMQRRSNYFDHPDQFIPERWNNDLEKQLPKGVYFPFSDGPRTCIGRGFAILEATLVLATIVQQFRLELVKNQTIIPKQSFTLRPEDGIQVIIRERQKTYAHA